MSIFLNRHLCNSLNSHKKLKKKFIPVKRRERKHNFTEVENEITYGESIVKKTRAKNPISFRHFTIDVAYLVLVICVSRKI